MVLVPRRQQLGSCLGQTDMALEQIPSPGEAWVDAEPAVMSLLLQKPLAL